jgi:hypothetical protein
MGLLPICEDQQSISFFVRFTATSAPDAVHTLAAVVESRKYSSYETGNFIIVTVNSTKI